MKSTKPFFAMLVCLAGLFLAACAPSTGAESATGWSMPKQAQAIHLNWVKGPPALQAFLPIDKHLAGYRSEDAVIALRSEQWGMRFDPRKMQLDRMVLDDTPDAVAELLDYAAIQSDWTESRLDLVATVEGKEYRPIGGPIPSLREDHSYAPVRLVESGDWYQHFGVWDLELVAATGEKLAAKSWFEVRAWGDRALLQWFVELESGAPAELSMDLQLGEQKQIAQRTGEQVELRLDLSGDVIQPIGEDEKKLIASVVSKNDFSLKAPSISYSEDSDAWEVNLPALDWPKKNAAAYNEDLLDRISRYDVKLENPTDEPREVSLRFRHHNLPVTGYVPMILDAKGHQTGLPVQNSKNWHNFREARYDGLWVNTTTRLTLVPRAVVDLEYIVAHAQWQGVPATSAGQLSLIGWGFDGFWTQMALGAWGESVCIQPGRTMRRSFITDVRPFDVIGRNGLPYDWTSNVGGGDIAKVVGADGKLITWLGAVREFEKIGPNLSHVRVTERSADNRMRLAIDTYLPRSNSINRSYFKVKLEALEDVAFQELALFQLGSDYYNELESTVIAWGNREGLLGQASPPQAEWGRVMEPVELPGEQAWVSLHANAAEPTAEGRGVRGLVIRDYRAALGGKVYQAPHLASARTRHRLNAELVLPPEVRTLKAGDIVEFTVEMHVLPLSAEAYSGGDDSLKARLEATPDSWELTAYEARHQTVQLDGQPQVFPATYAVTEDRRQSLTIRSQSRMDTLCLTGLTRPDGWQIFEQVDGAEVPIGERFPVEAEPQLSYRPESQTWTAVLSLVFPEGSQERTFVLELGE